MIKRVNQLNVRRVQHHTAGGAKGARGQGDGKLRTDGTAVSVGTGDLAPDALYLGALARLGLAGGGGRLGAVHVGDALAQVELGVGGRSDRLDLEDRSVRVLGALAALVSEVASLCVQSTK